VAARDEAERAGSAKTAFLATMSHEIRTPLNAVLGLTDLLLTTGLTEEQRTHLETISGSGDSLLTLINDVLDFSKIEAGELDLDQAPFDLADLVYDVAQLLAPQAAGKGLDLLVDLPLDCPWQVVGDGPRLRQVVMNLVGNAVKFTAHGVVIIRVAAEARGDRLSCRVAVSDTGIGIPADRRDRLFRSFSQVDASTTRSYGGTGLGLAISQRIARAMGGDITVDSEPGVGSTFTVAVELGVPAGAGVVDASGSLAGRRLLVVDDNPTNLKILGHQLARYGAEVVPAGGGAEALAAVTEQGDRLDAAILDLHMPGMAGDELAARLRALPVAAGLPLILLSSSTALDRQVWATFAARLHKPVRPDRLLRTVRSVLSAGDAEAAPDRRPEPASATGPRLRVLVAEDNAVNARLMELYLRQLGHDCVHVPNGEQAVTAVLGGGFDVVLMDAQMPVLGGVDATAAIRSVPGPQPRIVAVTASVLDSDRTAFLEAGADAFVAKPVRLATLAQALEVWDGEERRRTPAQPWTGVEHRGPVPGPAPAPAAVLDEETVEELRDLGDEGFGHLYRQYLTGLESTVAAILAAAGGPPLDPDDDGSLHRLAHRLKGSSAAMGATTVAEVCRRLEDGSGGDLDAELRTLREESERVRAAVTSLLAAG
jgi:CheY-like chemotaxis protein/HPt (histidine-containing phosphotransfer) domain-containing protein